MAEPVPVADLLQAWGFGTFGEDPGVEAAEACLQRLSDHIVAEAPAPIRLEALREAAVSKLKAAGGINAPAKMVEAAIRQAQGRTTQESEGQGTAVFLKDPEPWPHEVDADTLLSDLVRIFDRYISLPQGGATVLALWTLHAHALDAFDISPILLLTSPEKRCGKTLTLIVLSVLVPRPVTAANITAATLFRAVEKFGPTLLVDEADTFLGDRQELVGLINSGHHRANAFVLRCVGDEHEPRQFFTWAAKALAGIEKPGSFRDTLRDRSICLGLRRQSPEERRVRLRLDRIEAEGDPLRRKAFRWAKDHIAPLREADPSVPSGLTDRAADNWRPMLALADEVGGRWPERARRAASLLSGAGASEDDSVRVQLLSDVRDLFAMSGVDRLRSKEIVSELTRLEGRPWAEWRRGQPITANSLAKLLKPFGTKPTDIRFVDGVRKGYCLTDLSDAFTRYLPAQDPPAEPQHPRQPSDDTAFAGFPERNTDFNVADGESAKRPGRTTDVAGVAVVTPPSREIEGARETLEL